MSEIENTVVISPSAIHDHFYYILTHHDPPHVRRCLDVSAWNSWMKKAQESGKRRIGNTRSPRIRVSTVFTGINLNFRGYGKPVLFETMVFGGKHNDYQRRYRTYSEAVRGHEETCKMVWSEAKRKLCVEVKWRRTYEAVTVSTTVDGIKLMCDIHMPLNVSRKDRANLMAKERRLMRKMHMMSRLAQEGEKGG